MGLFRRKRVISAEEQFRRNGGMAGAPAGQSEKSFRDMTEMEKTDYWASVYHMTDLRERIRKMEEIAAFGYPAAYMCLLNDYLQLSQQIGYMKWDKINEYADKAVAAGNPEACQIMAKLCVREDNPRYDVDASIDYYAMAVELAYEPAVQEIQGYCGGSGEVKEIFDDHLKPAVDRLLIQDTKISSLALAYLYYYGVYFARDLNKAKEYFSRSASQGSWQAQMMLENPIFADDDDEDDEED